MAGQELQGMQEQENAAGERDIDRRRQVDAGSGDRSGMRDTRERNKHVFVEEEEEEEDVEVGPGGMAMVPAPQMPLLRPPAAAIGRAGASTGSGTGRKACGAIRKEEAGLRNRGEAGG